MIMLQLCSIYALGYTYKRVFKLLAFLLLQMQNCHLALTKTGINIRAGNISGFFTVF